MECYLFPTSSSFPFLLPFLLLFLVLSSLTLSSFLHLLSFSADSVLLLLLLIISFLFFVISSYFVLSIITFPFSSSLYSLASISSSFSILSIFSEIFWLAQLRVYDPKYVHRTTPMSTRIELKWH
jgi:hypothetical protein